MEIAVRRFRSQVRQLANGRAPRSVRYPLLCENSGAVATEAGWSTTGGHETSTWDGVAIPVPGQA